MRWSALLIALLASHIVMADGLLIRTEQQHPTRGIPRWKMYADPGDPSRVWLLVADNRDQLFLSTDGGASYRGMADEARNRHESDRGIEVASWIDNHVALTGSGDDLWVTYPHGRRLYVKKIAGPASSSANVGAAWELEVDPGVGKRSSIVATDDELFVFTRTSRSPIGNLRFFRYGHDGDLRECGFVKRLEEGNIRVGSTLDADSRPVVVVWTGSANRASLRYYRWDGEVFIEPDDSLIWDLSDGRRCDRGERTREFSLVVADDDTLHVVWACTRDRVVHARKQLGQRGRWRYEELVQNRAQREYDFTPMLTAQGTTVHVFLTLDGEDGRSSIWHGRFDPQAGSWDALERVSEGGDDSIANTVPRVHPSATHVPFCFWRDGSSVHTGRVRTRR